MSHWLVFPSSRLLAPLLNVRVDWMCCTSRKTYAISLQDNCRCQARPTGPAYGKGSMA